MKKFFEKLSISGLCMFAVMLVCSLIGVCGSEAVAADVTFGEPMSLEHALSNDDYSRIVENTIDKEVSKNYPNLSPLYTILKEKARSHKGTSPVIEYNEIDAMPQTSTVATAYAIPSNPTVSNQEATLTMADSSIFAVNQLLTFVGVDGYEEDGVTANGWFVGYIVEKAGGSPVVKAVNGAKVNGVANLVPSIPQGTVVIRGAHVGSEKQIRTEVMTAVPEKHFQYMEKHLIETEETTYFRISTDGAVCKWDKSDQTDYAIRDYKLAVESNILSGVFRKEKIKNKFNDKAEETYFSRGLFYQIPEHLPLPVSPTHKDLMGFMTEAFKELSSSDTKVLLVDPMMQEAILGIDYTQVVYPGKRTQKLGLSVQEIICGNQSLLMIKEPSFNRLGLYGVGMILDEAYLDMYSHAWRGKEINNYDHGTSDSVSQFFIDTFGVVAKNPKSHALVWLKDTASSGKGHATDPFAKFVA